MAADPQEKLSKNNCIYPEEDAHLFGIVGITIYLNTKTILFCLEKSIRLSFLELTQ